MVLIEVQQGRRCVTVSGKAYNPNTHRKTDSRQTHTETFYGLSQPVESEASHWGIVRIGSTWFLLQPDHVHSHKAKQSKTRGHTSGGVSFCKCTKVWLHVVCQTAVSLTQRPLADGGSQRWRHFPKYHNVLCWHKAHTELQTSKSR